MRECLPPAGKVDVECSVHGDVFIGKNFLPSLSEDSPPLLKSWGPGILFILLCGAYCCFLSLFFFSHALLGMWNLSSRPGIESRAVEVQGLNHWTTREVLLCGVCTWPPCLTQFCWFAWWFSLACFNIAISVVCCSAPFCQLLAPSLAGTPGHRGSLGTEAGFCFLPGCFFFFFWPRCGILDLSSQPGIDPGPPTVEVRSPKLDSLGCPTGTLLHQEQCICHRFL